MNFNSFLCRLCLLDNNNNVSIFTSFNERTYLPNKIMQIANIEIFEGDGLPSLICSACLSQVEAFFQFKSQVEKSDYFLRQQINNLQVDPLSPGVGRSQQESIKSESPSKDGDGESLK